MNAWQGQGETNAKNVLFGKQAGWMTLEDRCCLGKFVSICILGPMGSTEVATIDGANYFFGKNNQLVN